MPGIVGCVGCVDFVDFVALLTSWLRGFVGSQRATLQPFCLACPNSHPFGAVEQLQRCHERRMFPHPALPQWWPSSKSDPYAVVNIGDSGAATSVINQELNPEWGESFYLFVRWAAGAG